MSDLAELLEFTGRALARDVEGQVEDEVWERTDGGEFRHVAHNGREYWMDVGRLAAVPGDADYWRLIPLCSAANEPPIGSKVRIHRRDGGVSCTCSALR